MGSVLSSIWDDEKEWEEFKNKAGIIDNLFNLPDYDNPYSDTANNAKVGFSNFAFTGTILQKYIKSANDLDAAKRIHNKNLELLINVKNI